MSHQEHKQAASAMRARCAVVTLSDTRTEATDRSGERIKQLLKDAGHEVVLYAVIKDEPVRLDELLCELESRSEVEVILTNGGTGISQRDSTVPIVQKHLTVVLPGFGELFRMLSHEQIGSSAMLSRALGGVAAGKVLFAMPGSTAAVELALSRLILPELGHLLQELRK